jgi:hypothetical protein
MFSICSSGDFSEIQVPKDLSNSSRLILKSIFIDKDNIEIKLYILSWNYTDN